MNDDFHLMAPWGTLIQPEMDPRSTQPRGFSRRLFLRGAAASMALAAMPRQLTAAPTTAAPTTAAPAVRNLGPMVYATDETTVAVEDFHPLRRTYAKHYSNLYDSLINQYRTYDNIPKTQINAIDKEAARLSHEDAVTDAMENDRDIIAEMNGISEDEVTRGHVEDYLENMDDDDLKVDAFEEAFDEDTHRKQWDEALENLRTKYTPEELALISIEPHENGPEADSHRWHAGVAMPWKINGPAQIVRDLIDEVGHLDVVSFEDENGNELLDDASNTEGFAKLMAGQASPRQNQIIKQHLAPDPLDRVPNGNMDELRDKISKSLKNFLSGKTVEAVYRATQQGQSGATEQEVRNLDEAIMDAGQILDGKVTIYRPLDANTVPRTKNAIGHDLHDQTFLTGTTDLDRALSLIKPGGDILAIEVPAGARVLRSDTDVMLPRHSRLSITDHAVTENGPGIIKATLK